MSIKDIPLSDTTTTPLAVPVPVVPESPSLETILQTNKGPVTADPQSGSILKILADNGFQQKIEEGYRSGHAYTILHSAPSADFTLIDMWTETSVDEDGNTVTNPRKTYQFFKIVGEPAVTPKPVSDNTPQPPLKEGEPNTQQISSAEEKPIEKAVPIMAEMPPTVIPGEQNRAEEVANKIKRGGAGMTAEDWQYRNENWPAIEKFLMPASSPAQPATDAPQPPLKEGKPNQSPGEQAPLLAGEGGSRRESGEVAPAAVTIPVAAAPSELPEQHYDARAWLMRRLGRPNVETPAATSTVLTTPPGPAPSNSYDLLKMKFGKTASAPTSLDAPQPPLKEAEPQPIALTSQQKANAFVQGIFQTSTAEWEAAKNIPARAFIYPTEYAWGSDEKGNQISRSLENYPEHAMRLREKIAESIEELKDQGMDIETLTIGDAITAAIDKGTLMV